MCKPWASDRIGSDRGVPLPDWPGLARIGGVNGGAADFEGQEDSSSPTSAQCFHCSGAWWPLSVDKLLTDGPHLGSIFVWGGRCCGRVALSRGFSLRYCCSLIHGQERLGPHDLLLIGDQAFLAIAVGSRNGLSVRAGAPDDCGHPARRSVACTPVQVSCRFAGPAEPVSQLNSIQTGAFLGAFEHRPVTISGFSRRVTRGLRPGVDRLNVAFVLIQLGIRRRLSPAPCHNRHY